MNRIIKQKGTGCTIRGEINSIELAKFLERGWVEVETEEQEIDN